MISEGDHDVISSCSSLFHRKPCCLAPFEAERRATVRLSPRMGRSWRGEGTCLVSAYRADITETTTRLVLSLSLSLSLCCYCFPLRFGVGLVLGVSMDAGDP
ncbi:unnamed protein product [Musa acuminata subsp. burmannicoides]